MKDLAQFYLTELKRDLADNRLQLPSLPEVALRVRDLAADPNCDLARLAKVVAQDAAIAARLLKVANSSLLRRAKTLESIHQAVCALGVQQVRFLVTQLAILQAMKPQSNPQRLRDFIALGYCISSYCRELASRHPHLDPELAALIGLLHDIGKLPLRDYLRQRPELTEPLRLQLELVLHPALGAMMLRDWQLPEPVVQAVRQHELILRSGAIQPDYADLLVCANLLYFGTEKGRYQQYHQQALERQIPAMVRVLPEQDWQEQAELLKPLLSQAEELCQLTC